MENKSHALIAGAFVLLVSALLVAMAIWLTRDKSVHHVYELSSRENVTGLQPQATVKFRGVSVGKVMGISFDPQNRGNVLIRISTDELAPVSKSTFATLGFQGVTGLAFVQLDDSGESKEDLPTREDAPARIPMRSSLFTKLSEQGTNILVQVEESSRKLNQLLTPDNQKVLLGAVQNIGQAATGLGQAANSIQRFSSNADKILDAQFGPEKMNLPKLAAEVADTLKSLQTTSKSLEATSDEARALAGEFKQVSQALVKPGGMVDKLTDGVQTLTNVGQSLYNGTLPRVNRTSDETARAARQVSRTVNGVNDNPQSLIFGNGPALPGPGETGFAPPLAAAGKP